MKGSYIFPNNSHKIYLRRKFEEDTTLEIIKCLGKISQCRVANKGFEWRIIKACMKKNIEEGKLGDEQYKLVAFCYI
jgi:hypothetical protein